MLKKKGRRECVLSIKMTVKEKAEVTAFAERRSVNLSAFVRKLLEQELQRELKVIDSNPL